MSNNGRIGGERVYCHQCASEWPRDQGGLTCPTCASEFTEILEDAPAPIPPTPGAFPSEPFGDLLPTRSSPTPFHDHSPWRDVPDPDEDDVTTFFDGHGGGGPQYRFTTGRTVRLGGGPGRGNMNMVDDPLWEETVGNFGTMLTGMVTGAQPGAGNPGMQPTVSSFSGFFGMGGPVGQRTDPFGRRAPATAEGVFMPAGGVTIQAGNARDLFTMLFQTVGNLEQAGSREARPGAPPNPFAFLTQLLNPANAQHGDAVFSQEALDRVISQLMEQHAGSSAPGPASDSAIQNLPQKKVDASMMGSDGTAECSICMENVQLGEQVTTLPCSHWFHQACVTAWLKEHDTCPHCRKGITNTESQNGRPCEGASTEQGQQDSGGGTSSRRRPSRRSSSVSWPRSPAAEGTIRNPYAVPESPTAIRSARQEYFSNMGGRTRNNEGNNRLSRPPSHEQRLPSERDRYAESGQWSYRREGSGNNQNSAGGDGSGGGGGVTSWLRNHLPFQG